jgi:glycerol-3-phosphate acyltransferase PlsY
VYLGFKSSGRGIFTSLGVIGMLSWKLGLIMLVFPYLWAPIKQLALGVFIALVSLPLLSWFLAQPLDIEEKLPITCGFVALSSMALMKRVIARRSDLSKSVPLGEVVFNRLLFDRDIADRRLWIGRGTAKG